MWRGLRSTHDIYVRVGSACPQWILRERAEGGQPGFRIPSDSIISDHAIRPVFGPRLLSCAGRLEREPSPCLKRDRISPRRSIRFSIRRIPILSPRVRLFAQTWWVIRFLFIDRQASTSTSRHLRRPRPVQRESEMHGWAVGRDRNYCHQRRSGKVDGNSRKP